MYCRCRILRAYHETLYSLTSTRRSFSAHSASNILSPSALPENPPGAGTIEPPKPNLDNALRGSTKSPLAFKPLPGTSMQNMDESDLDPWPPGDMSLDTGRESPPQEEYVQRGKLMTKKNWEKKQRQFKEAAPFEDSETALNEWNILRTTNRDQMTNVSAIKWAIIAMAACELDSTDVLTNFAQDLMEAHKNAPRTQETMVLKILHKLIFPGGCAIRMQHHPTYLSLATSWLPVENNSTLNKNLDQLIVSVYKAYYSIHPDSVPQMSPQLITHLGLVALRTKDADLISEGPLLTTFLSQLRKEEPSPSLRFPPLSPTSVVIGPSPELFPLYRTVQTLLDENADTKAFHIFQKLIKEQFISGNAISQIRLDGGDLKDILLFAMVRSCLDYQWIFGAFELLLRAVQAGKHVARSRQTRGVINETVYSILEGVSSLASGPLFAFSGEVSSGGARTYTRRVPSRAIELLKRSLYLISGLRDTDKGFMLEDKVIQLFYELAYKLDAGSQAEALYSLDRYNLNSRHKQHVSSPSPLLMTPAFRKTLPTSASSLSSTDPKSVPPRVPETDENGAAVPLPKPRRYPPPHGAPLTWLLSYLATTSKNIHLSRVLADEIAEKEIDIPLLDRSKFVYLIANFGFAASARRIWTRYSDNANSGVIGHAATVVRLVSLFSDLSRKIAQAEASNPEEYDGAVADTTKPSEDLKQFAELVVSKFQSVKEPLAEAVHQDLNALVRAYFMTGQVTEGFEVLRILMKKKERPDLYDVNVALSGVAKYSPREAGKMIEGMIDRGLLPDAVTFGTVIQAAILRKDNELMVQLVRRAREVDEGQLTFKTIAALVRASVADAQRPLSSDKQERKVTLPVGDTGHERELILGGDDLRQMKTNLATAWALMQTFKNGEMRDFKARAVIGLANLGERCMLGALAVGDAELAFKFWEGYMKRKVQWKDDEQTALRLRLARLVQTSRDEGQLEMHKAKIMLGELDGNAMGVW